MRRCLLLLAGITALTAAAPAQADDLVAELPRDTPVGAYGGAVAWSAYDAGSARFRLMVIPARGEAPAAAPVAPAQRAFDVGVGPDARNRPVALYTRCTRSGGTRGCDVYRYDFALRRERRLGLSSPREDEAWPVQWGARVAFVRRHRMGGRGEVDDCDVPFVTVVSSTRPARRLDRGSCGTTTGMSIRRDRIVQVTFGTPPDATRFDSQVRRLSARGGRMTLLARQGSGEESNVFSSPSQSADSVWVTRTGVNPRPMFVRIDARSGARREVRALTRLTGPLARDERGTFHYVEGGSFGGGACQELDLAPCRLARTRVSPFSRRQRALLPTLTLGAPDGPVAFGDPYVLSGRLSRKVVSAGRVVRTDPLPGVPLELLRVVQTIVPGMFVSERTEPTGILVTTDAAGRWSYTVPSPGPSPWFTAVTRAAQVPATYAGRGDAGFVEARITLAHSTTTFAGTVTPGQPGRTVRIQRLAARVCQTAATGQRFCADRWTTVASAALSGAGTTFSATVAAPQPGTYRAAILREDLAGDATAYPGASTEIAVGG